MRVLVAFDKFKDALSASAACETVAAVLRTKHPDWQLDLCPLTDGGEGFANILGSAASGRADSVCVQGPCGASVTASLAFAPGTSLPAAARKHLAGTEGLIAVAGLASASGLELLSKPHRDPWQTSTFGTGELLRHAAEENPDALLLGLGGSATNDLGLGALAALGFRFLDDTGREIMPPVPATWEKISRIDGSGAVKLPPAFIACDVVNPLLGPDGATAIFGPQKGLSAADVPRLEAQAARMAALLCTACGQPPSLAEKPGTGAAGGIAFGLMVAFGARLVPGFDLVSDWLDLPARLAAADLVITGEGRFDETSLAGKGPGSIVAGTRRLGKTVHVFAGSLGVPPGPGFHAITPPGLPLEEALPRTAELLAAAVARNF